MTLDGFFPSGEFFLYGQAGLTAIIISLLATGPITLIAKKMRLVDDPARRFHPAHTHTGVIPRAGGAALFLSVALAILFFIPLSKLTIGLLVSAGLLVGVGLLDDYRDVHPLTRFIINAVASIVVVGAGAGIPYITNPLNGTILHLDTWRISFEFFGFHSILVWSDIVAFLWILWTINIVGWSAGVDGQMPGFVAISAFTLGLLSLRYSLLDPSQQYVTLLAFIVAGSFAGFIPWNFYPQKIMPGYGGKTLAGLLLGILGILSYGKLGTALLVLGIPTMDALYTLLRRLGKRKPLMKADRGHLHHRLLDLGWSKPRIALFYWGVSAILGATALTVTSRQKLFTLLLVAVGVGGFLAWVNFFTRLSKPSDPDSG